MTYTITTTDSLTIKSFENLKDEKDNKKGKHYEDYNTYYKKG